LPSPTGTPNVENHVKGQNTRDALRHFPRARWLACAWVRGRLDRCNLTIRGSIWLRFPHSPAPSAPASRSRRVAASAPC
jgi:hypothetical protein